MKKRTLFLFLPLLLAACAMTRTDGTFAYTPRPSAIGDRKLLLGARFRDVQVFDERVDVITHQKLKEPKLILNKRNGYGMPVEGFYAFDHPIADYVRDGFEKTLNQMSALEVSDAPVELVVRIKAIEEVLVKPGFIKKDKEALVIATTVAIVDVATGKPRWQRIVVGGSNLKVASLVLSVEDIANSFPATLNSLIDQSIYAPGFTASFGAYQSTQTGLSL